MHTNLWLCAALFILGAPVARAAPPHIVLVMADDQGWGDMAYQGHPHLVTPNFDAAAARGLLFDRFYAAAPVCSPTRASVLTGRHPNRARVFSWGHPLPPQEYTIAEALRGAGYATAHFGKWHLGSVRRASPTHPGRHGFDTWLSAPNFYDNDPILSRGGTAVPTPGESSMVAVDAAIAWIRSALDGDAPLFCVVWFGSPHLPHRAVEEDRAHYPGAPAPVQNFLGEITGMDRAFGRLRSALDDLGIRNDTLLWYCSDNGALPRVGSTGGHRGVKGAIYDGGLLVPAFLEWPARLPAPRRATFRANTSDIFPTLLSVAGVVPPDRALDGVDLTPLFDDPTRARAEPMGFWAAKKPGISTPSAKWMRDLLDAQAAGGDLDPHPSNHAATLPTDPPAPTDRFPGHAAWIDGDWKLHRMETDDGAVRFELYDIAADPAETINRATQAPGRAKSMTTALRAWLESVVRSANEAGGR